MRYLWFAGVAFGLILSGCGGGGNGSSAAPLGKIVFASTRDGNGDIYLMDDDGTNVRKITTSSGTAINPSLSRDRTKIIYASRKAGPSYDLFVVNADGTGDKRLTDSPEDEIEPDLSPDGRTILFTRAGSVYAINSDGTGERRLTDAPGNSENASFNPHGDKIVFISDRGGSKFQVFMMNADGSGQQALTDANLNTGPRFSPDGTQIVFVSKREGENFSESGIFLMNVDGSNVHRLLPSSSAIDLEPAFSPEGERIVFTSNRSGGHFNLFTLHTDGTTATRLTNNRATDAFPCWR